jgi:protein transport protein SEC24
LNLPRDLCSSNAADTASGHTQWEPPAPSVDAAPASAPAPARKGRQYAAGQTNAYYGDANAGYGDAGGGYGAQAPGPAGYAAPDAGATPGGQIFTPGLASEPQFGGPQNTYFGGAPAAGYQGAPAPGYQGAAAGYPGTPGAGYPGTPATGYPAGPGAAPAPGYGAGSVDQLAGQFGGMGFGPGMGQKPPGLQTANLLTQPPDPVELLQPPPESRLPAGACISNSPHIADGAMYQRCTMNAIPTSSSLLGKTKMPLALVINPYPSVREGEAEIPVITDQIIARCRRCRLYINPFVQVRGCPGRVHFMF